MWLIAAVGIALVGLLVVSYGPQAAGATPVQALAALSLVGSLLAFILSGALIVSRQPRNTRWLLMIPGLSLPASTLATNWLGAMPPPPQVTPVLWLVLWALSWSWILLIFPILHGLLLTFPDGHLLSPRWRLAVAFELAMVTIFLGFTAFAEELGVLVEDEKSGPSRTRSASCRTTCSTRRWASSGRSAWW